MKPKKRKAKDQSFVSRAIFSLDNDNDEKDVDDCDESAHFEVCSNPAQLLNLDIIW